LHDPTQIREKLHHICGSLASDARKRGLQGKTLTVKMKSPGFEVKQRGKSFDIWFGWELEVIYKLALQIMENDWPQAVRLVMSLLPLVISNAKLDG